MFLTGGAPRRIERGTLASRSAMGRTPQLPGKEAGHHETELARRLPNHRGHHQPCADGYRHSCVGVFWKRHAPSGQRLHLGHRPVRVGGDPDGVAADPKTHTVYVTNISRNTVSVISGRSNTVTATIRVGLFPARVATNPKTNTIYVANAASSTVSVISGQTNTVTATIRVGGDPDGVAVDSKTNTIYVATVYGTTLRSAPCSAHAGMGLLRSLPITPSKFLPSPGPYRCPSTLSRERFSNSTTTM